MAQKPDSSIGSAIKALRQRSKMSIADLAAISGLDPSYLSHLELGQVKNPTLSTLRKIARAFKVPVSEVLDTTEAGPENLDFQLSQALRMLLLRHGKERRVDILTVLKALRDPKRLEAVRSLVAR